MIQNNDGFATNLFQINGNKIKPGGFMQFILIILATMFIHGVPSCSKAAPFAPDKIVYKTVTIASAGTTSAALDIGGYTIVGMSLPAALTSTAATFHVSSTIAGTYVPVFNTSGALSYTVAASRYVLASPNDTYGLRFIKLVVGSAEAAERSIILHLRAM